MPFYRNCVRKCVLCCGSRFNIASTTKLLRRSCHEHTEACSCSRLHVPEYPRDTKWSTLSMSQQYSRLTDSTQQQILFCHFVVLVFLRLTLGGV